MTAIGPVADELDDDRPHLGAVGIRAMQNARRPNDCLAVVDPRALVAHLDEAGTADDDEQRRVASGWRVA